MHANLPVIANRWEKKYGLGGVAELNAELNSLPEYYLPFPAAQGGRIGFEQGSGPMTFKEYFKGKSKFEIDKTREDMIREYEEYLFRQKYGPQDRPNVAQGGLIPAHQAGIYGLAEGGRIGFPGGGGTEGDYQDDWSTGAETTDTSSDDGGYQNVHDTGAVTQTPGRTTPTTTNDNDGDARSKYLATQYLDPVKKKQTYVAPRSGKTIESNLATKKLGIKYSGSGPEEDSGLVKALKFIGTAAAVVGTGGTILGLGDLGIVKIASKINTVNKLTDNAVTAFNIINNTDFTKTELFNKIQTDAKNTKKMNYEWDKDPSGLGYGKDLVDKTVIDDTDNGQTNGRTDIQKEGQKIALKRKQEQDWASYLAQLAQEKVNRAKQAYLKNYRQSYMSAKGGRVPGYNTGGLSNLFKLNTA